MPTNKYFQNFPDNPSEESMLVEDLINETIEIWGTDCFYIPRDSQSSPDYIYGEDPGSIFNKAYAMEMYVSNPGIGFEGPSEMFTKFGLEINDTVRLILARRVFQKTMFKNQSISDPEEGMQRPKEGDLVYVPAFANLFEIKFVEEERDFYSIGRRPPMFYYFELQCELYKFSNERFNTGISEIDRLASEVSFTISLDLAPSGNGNYITGEFVYQGANVTSANTRAIVKQWDRVNHVLQIRNIKGVFSNTANIVGNTSGAIYTIQTDYDIRDFDEVIEQFTNNLDIEEESDGLVLNNPRNPFGTP